MADSMDIVQQRTDEMLARNIALIVNRAPAVSSSFCEDCDAPIPKKRRRAYLGVTRCVSCQEIEEQRNKHLTGNS
ncbi:TraR/DksA family transcriptional regulator [Pantoea sp. At-9b]|uniref:TraR/DksA family transcriptional regulator n=1 Tax=Pantoea sp. (strain At-9b) TaxID=592316 RepID=UPI0001B3E82E|nr:TraR/DksA family transcriptional regulator [Pantoea sp. At-9b]ADU69576.1 transcriptional regulator, TraR/DksA family [Pantoea sp. At-9b]